MKNIIVVSRVFLLACAACFFARASDPSAGSGDAWPQIAHDAQRTGRSPGSPRPPFQVEWNHKIENERIGDHNQPIVAEGKVFIGTLEGVMHCWPLDGGEYKERAGMDIWSFSAAGPIVQAAGYADKRVFFGAIDGCCYALDAGTGELIWKADVGFPGFSQAALPAEGKLFMGDRAGVFYAFAQESGEILWRYECGAPFIASAAYADGRVYCAAEDMKLRALDAGTGALVWESETMPGNGFLNYYPVVDAGKVIVRTIPFTRFITDSYSYSVTGREEGKPFIGTSWHGYPDAARAAGAAYWRGKETPRPRRLAEFNAATRAAYAAEPEAMTFHVLDTATGERAYIVPIVYNMVNTGTPYPPVVGSDGFWYAGTTMNGQANSCQVVKIDPATGDIVDTLQEYVGGYDNDGWGGKNFTVMPDGTLGDFVFLGGTGPGDEDSMFSVGGDVLYGRYWRRCWDGLDLKTRIPFSHPDYVDLYTKKWGREQGHYKRGFAMDVLLHAFSGPVVCGDYVLGNQAAGVGYVFCVKSLAGEE